MAASKMPMLSQDTVVDLVNRRTPEPLQASGAPHRQAPWLAVQQAAGNQALMRLLAAEREAGRAERAVRHLGDFPALSGSLPAGRPLPEAARAELEAGFGHDFGDVRVHTDEMSALSAQAAGARAYTVGEDIVFGPARYAPGTTEGKRVLAHELAHVVQQTRMDGPRTAPASAESEAQEAASTLISGGTPDIQCAAAGLQRDDLTDEDRRRRSSSQCPTGRCHEPVRPTAAGRTPLLGGDRGSAAPGWTPTLPQADLDMLRTWMEQQDQPGPAAEPGAHGAGDLPQHLPVGRAPFGLPAHRLPADLPVMQPPANMKAPPRIAQLGTRSKVIHVVDLIVPEYRFGPLGSTRMFSQAEPVAVHDVMINQPDPSAGYNFDTYLRTQTGQIVAAQHVSGTLFRVFMGTAECPGCHFGRGLVVDLHGQSFVTVMAQGMMNAMALSDAAAMLGGEGPVVLGGRGPVVPPGAGAEADEAALAASRRALRTPDDEFRDFQQMLKDEGATEFTSAGEPVTMQPHGGASEARQTLGVTGENQSMHGLPRSVGRNMPGYDPEAALTTLGERQLHTELDQPWKDAFQAMRRQGRTTASAQEIYNEVANSIESSSQLSSELKNTLKLRLHDEMFIEYGLTPGQQMTLPYRNIKPRL
jgi:hypothetical protein